MSIRILAAADHYRTERKDRDIDESWEAIHIHIDLPSAVAEIARKDAMEGVIRCPECGEVCIDGCVMCGAPQCCPACCAEESKARLQAP